MRLVLIEEFDDRFSYFKPFRPMEISKSNAINYSRDILLLSLMRVDFIINYLIFSCLIF